MFDKLDIFALVISIMSLSVALIDSAIQLAKKVRDNKANELKTKISTIRQEIPKNDSGDALLFLAQSIQNIVCEYYQYKEEDVHVSIRRLCEASSDYDVVTLHDEAYASDLTSHKHKSKKKKYITSRNTDLSSILKNKAPFFFLGNISSYMNGHKYNNSSPLYTDSYKSTLVVPIKIKRMIVGFLIVDCKNEMQDVKINNEMIKTVKDVAELVEDYIPNWPKPNEI